MNYIFKLGNISLLFLSFTFCSGLQKADKSEKGDKAEKAEKVEKPHKNSIGMEFQPIPAGEFEMGCSNGDKDCDNSENPVHKVKISKLFYLGKTEVTQGQWKAVMGNNPSTYSSCGDNCPVETVSWEDVQSFIKKLNEKEGGNKYRLPTEAEWEYAARATSKAKFYWGSFINDSHLWYDGNSGSLFSGKKTHPVAEKEKNKFELYDMIGNVCEWVQDWYGNEYYAKSPPNDPTGPETGTARVFRGRVLVFGTQRCSCIGSRLCKTGLQE